MFIIKANLGYKKGWREIKRFDNPAAADKWLCEYIRNNGYSVTDFIIIRK